MKFLIHIVVLVLFAAFWTMVVVYMPFKHAENQDLLFRNESVEKYLSQKIDGYVKGRRYYIDDKDPGYIAAVSEGKDVFINALRDGVFLHGIFMFFLSAAFAFYYKRSTYLAGFLMFIPSLLFLAIFKVVIGVIFTLLGWTLGVCASRKIGKKHKGVGEK